MSYNYKTVKKKVVTQSMSPRSILELTIEELEQVFKTNELPEGVSISGIDTRTDFDKLYKHRLNPKYIAQTLLRERLHTRIMVESPEIKNERLQLKQAELELKRMKIESNTQMYSNVYKRLQAIESTVTLIVSGITNLNQQMSDVLQKLNEQSS